MAHTSTDIAALKESLTQQSLELASALFPDRPIQVTAPEIRIGNNGSMVICRGRGMYFDHERGEGGDLLTLIQRTLRLDFNAALGWARDWLGQAHVVSNSPPPPPVATLNKRKEWQRLKAIKIWDGAIVSRGGRLYPADSYFKSRAIVTDPRPDDVRLVRSIYNHTTQDYHPAIVAAFRNADAEMRAIHLTFLTPDGRKISGKYVKAKLTLGPYSGCAIRLAPAFERVALTEGIEDALSVMQLYGWPCWATGSTSGLRSVRLPDHIKEVWIFADADAPGIAAAKAAARRLRDEGRQVRITIPPGGFKDFNELLQNQKNGPCKGRL